MVSRGEVALIVANKGFSAGLINTTVLAPILIVVIATTILSPILLKMSYTYKTKWEKSELNSIDLNMGAIKDTEF